MTKINSTYPLLLLTLLCCCAVPAISNDEIPYRDETNGFSLQHPSVLKAFASTTGDGIKSHDSKRPVLVLRDPSFRGADVGDSTPVEMEVLVGQLSDFPRPAMVDYLDMETPVKPKVEAIQLSGTHATKLIYRNGAPEGGTDVLIITELNTKDRMFLIRGKYTLRGCAHEGNGPRADKCKKEVTKEGKARTQQIEKMIRSFKLEK